MQFMMSMSSLKMTEGDLICSWPLGHPGLFQKHYVLLLTTAMSLRDSFLVIESSPVEPTGCLFLFKALMSLLKKKLAYLTMYYLNKIHLPSYF